MYAINSPPIISMAYYYDIFVTSNQAIWVQNVVYCSRIPSKISHYFSHRVFLGSCWLWQFFILSLFFKTLKFLEVLVNHLIEWSSTGNCLRFFFMARLEQGAWGQRRPERRSSIFITSYQEYLLPSWLIPVVDLDHLAEVVFVRFLLYKDTIVPPFQKEVTRHKWPLKSGVMVHLTGEWLSICLI